LLGFQQDFRLEPNLEDMSGPQELIATAAVHARDVDAVCQAVGTIISLKSLERPSEAMLASVNTFLWNLVSDIESRLRPQLSGSESLQPTSWDLLRGSGLLTQPDMVDYALARFAEKQLHNAIQRDNNEQELEQVAARLLHHENNLVSDAAQIFLAAASKQNLVSGVAIENIDPHLLHKMCWRVIAAWEILEGKKDPNSADAARNLLSNHDEAQTLRSAARKLIFFLDADERRALANPNEASIYLFVAWLAAELSIEYDHVVRLAASQSITPLAMMLRAVGLEQEHAMEILFLLKGFELRPSEVMLFEQSYAKMTEIQALQSIQLWAADRARLLLGIDRADPVSI
jgi:hypothetical protein